MDGYFPVSPDLPGLTITARSTDPPYSRPVIIGDLGSTVPISPGAVVTSANIACKAEGRPKAQIEWSAVDSSGDAVPINISDVIVPREGRSILRVVFDSSETGFITYTCTATNNAGEVNGQVIVEPTCKYIIWSCAVVTDT